MYQWYAGEIPSVFGAPVYSPFNSTGWTLRVAPGLSSFSTHPSDLPAYFQPFMEYAKARIRPSDWPRTFVFLYATAGMRLLSVPDQTRILEETRDIFLKSPFRFLRPSWARIISGVDEGVYGWMTANYLLGKFEAKDPLATVGALDLGGASTQITFVPSMTPIAPEEGGTQVTIGNTVYPLYSVSFLGLGIDQARERKNDNLRTKFCPDVDYCPRIDDGCLPMGYEISLPQPNGHFIPYYGTSDPAFCQIESKGVPLQPTCANCTIGSVQQPPIRGQFYAMSGFAHAMPIFKLNGSDTSIEEIENAAKAWCVQNYDQMRDRYPNLPTAFLTSYCFTGMWETTLLRIWGFPAAQKQSVIFTEQIGGIPLSWTLGAMVMAAQEVDSMQPISKP